MEAACAQGGVRVICAAVAVVMDALTGHKCVPQYRAMANGAQCVNAGYGRWHGEDSRGGRSGAEEPGLQGGNWDRGITRSTNLLEEWSPHTV